MLYISNISIFSTFLPVTPNLDSNMKKENTDRHPYSLAALPYFH